MGGGRLKACLISKCVNLREPVLTRYSESTLPHPTQSSYELTWVFVGIRWIRTKADLFH